MKTIVNACSHPEVEILENAMNNYITKPHVQVSCLGFSIT